MTDVNSKGGVCGGCCCCCRLHRVAWEMESKLAPDASKRGRSQPEASDVVGVGRQQADPRLGGGSEPAGFLSCGEREKARRTGKPEAQ